jgi:adenylate cyclase
VNIAARLEGLAEPGGICLSEAVHNIVRKALPLAYADLGEQGVKGFDEPVRAYTVKPAVTLAPIRMESKPLPLPDKPSIAVLPFTNMSGDAEQEYSADGVVEEIITALSRVKSFFVVARNSSFTYRGRAVDVQQVGRELGVRYVLNGSIRKAGSRVRIAGQLIETATGHHVWADRFDGGLEDIFNLQDSITENVVGAIEPSIFATEIARARAKPTERLDAYDLYLRSLREVHTGTEQGFLRAERLLRDSLARDPDFPEALSALSDCLMHLVVRASVESSPGTAEACEIALRAAALSSDNGAILATSAWTISMLGGLHDQGKEFAERALRLHPNSADVRTACGWSFLFGGEPEHAQEHFEVARRLNPVDPRTFFTQTAMASANFYQRRFDKTVEWSTRVLEQRPAWVPALRYRAAALTHLGRLDEARADLAKVLAAQPSCTLRWLTIYTFRHRWMQELFIDALRRAGLPE